ncbi:MAG: L-fucose isomerase [Bifidobacteriaceae bacterium]|jgi:L-fucose isomerase|nr:L-fucose isomerase [Bifidobacteriaceae bacterium]
MPNHPRIGIRPVIDGRRMGVRESLEHQTMAQAQATAQLLAQNLRYPDGAPVETVIADTTIGGVAEAAACAEKFRHEDVGLTVTVTPCWCYGTETMDLDPAMPHAIWGFNGTERPGAVYLAAALAAHAQLGIPAFGIYGHDVQDSGDTSIPEDVARKLLAYARAALAVALMRGKSYLAMGSVSMGIAGSMVDPGFWREYLGMRNEYIDMSEIARRVELGIFDQAEYAKARAWVADNCVQGFDNNPEALRLDAATHQAQWDYVTKMALIARDLMTGNPVLAEAGWGEEALGHNAIAAGFQGQRQWTDFRPNGDFMETMLNSGFDWNGPRQPLVLATENDALNAASMLFGHLLTGTAQIFADVRTYWSPEAVKRVTGHDLDGPGAGGVLHLINSGSACLDGTGRARDREGRPVMKPFWDLTAADAAACVEAATFHPGNREYFRGGGFSTRFLTEGGMPVTMCRLNLVKGLGPVLQLAEGHTVGLPPEVHDTLDRRTDPTWPTTWFAPALTGEGAFASTYDVMDNWGANHGAISYGHIGADLITLASILRIPVNMHNVARDRIFRPRVWSAFGTAGPEAADLAACANFGPLYG